MTQQRNTKFEQVAASAIQALAAVLLSLFGVAFALLWWLWFALRFFGRTGRELLFRRLSLRDLRALPHTLSRGFRVFYQDVGESVLAFGESVGTILRGVRRGAALARFSREKLLPLLRTGGQKLCALGRFSWQKLCVFGRFSWQKLCIFGRFARKELRALGRRLWRLLRIGGRKLWRVLCLCGRKLLRVLRGFFREARYALRTRAEDLASDIRGLLRWIGTRPLRRARRFCRARPLPEWGQVFALASLAFLLGIFSAYLAESVRLGALAGFQSAGAMALTALLTASVTFFLTVVTGELALAFTLPALTVTLFGFANFCKTVINGTPITTEDLRLLRTLRSVTDVAGDLPKSPWLVGGLIAIAVLAVLLWTLSPALARLHGRMRFLTLCASLSVLLIFVFGNGAKPLGRAFSLDMQTRQEAEQTYGAYGAVAGIWRDYAMRGDTEITDYSEAYMQNVLARIDARIAEHPVQARAEEDYPNIVVLQQESQFDISKLPGVRFSEDPVACFHALAEEGETGSFYSRYLGFGTGYIEMGVLSGLNSRYLRFGTNVCFLEPEDYGRLAAMPQVFADNGYFTGAYHSHTNELYNRTENFPRLGFEETLFEDEMDGKVFHGAYVADGYFANFLCDRMEELNREGKRAFLFGITMENHQPFVETKFTETSGVTAESALFTPEAAQIFQCVTEGTVYADRALGEMVERFKEQEEPVVLIAFGDHRPNLSVGEEDNIFRILGLTKTAAMGSLPLDEMQTLYTTDYLIWSNVPELQEELAGAHGMTSYSTLGADVLRLAGVPMSRYWQLIGLCREASLVDADSYFADGSGRLFRNREEAGLSSADEELLELLRAVVYDAYYGEGYITAEMNEAP